MSDDNTQNNQDQNENNNQNDQQSNTPSTRDIIIGCDTNNGNDANAITTVAEGLKKAGYNVVQQLSVGPGPFSQYGYTNDAKGKVGIYLMAASLFSFADGAKDLYDKDIFVIRGDASHLVTSQEAFETSVIPRDADCNSVCDEWEGMTYPQMNEKAQGKCVAVYGGTTAEEMLQAALQALGGATDMSGSVTSSGGGAQIKDKTFEDCIKRICAATDSIFLVENNAAILFPYTDWMAFTLRRKIQQIKAKDMDPDLFEIDYNTDGFYNKVTVVWGADEEQDQLTSDKTNEEDKKTIGNITTIQKTMPTGGTQISEQYDSLVNIYGVLEKKVTTNFPNEETAHFVMNALLIQYIRDFNNSCRVRVINNQKFVGGTFYAIENPKTNQSELFYLNSYRIFKEKDQPLVSDMEFKYGPEGAEELLDYQNYGGGSSSSGGASAPTDEPQEVKEIVNKVCQGLTDPMQKMMALHNYLKDHITYGSHSCTKYSTPQSCIQHIGDLNCADTSRLTRSCMGAAGLDAEVVHGDKHFWTVITINGKEYASDAVSAYHEIGDVWTPSGTVHANDGGPYYEKCGPNPNC